MSEAEKERQDKEPTVEELLKMLESSSTPIPDPRRLEALERVRALPEYEEVLARLRLWMASSASAAQNAKRSLHYAAGGDPDYDPIPRDERWSVLSESKHFDLYKPTARSLAFWDSLSWPHRKAVVKKLEAGVKAGYIPEYVIRERYSATLRDGPFLDDGEFDADAPEAYIMAYIELLADRRLPVSEQRLLWDLIQAVRDKEAEKWIDILKSGPKATAQKKRERAELAARVTARHDELLATGRSPEEAKKDIYAEFDISRTQTFRLLKEHEASGGDELIPE